MSINPVNLVVDGALTVTGSETVNASTITDLTILGELLATTGSFTTLYSSTKVQVTSGNDYSIAILLDAVVGAGTANTGVTTAVDMLAGSTTIKGLKLLNSHNGFLIPANTLHAESVLRLKLMGTYSTNGASSTITPNIQLCNSTTNYLIGTGVASGTFATLGTETFSLDVMLYCQTATTMMCAGALELGNANPASTVAGSCSIASASSTAVSFASGSVDLILCPTWAYSVANPFQTLTGTLEILN